MYLLALRISSSGGISRARTYDLHDVNADGKGGENAESVVGQGIEGDLEFQSQAEKSGFLPVFDGIWTHIWTQTAADEILFFIKRSRFLYKR